MGYPILAALHASLTTACAPQQMGFRATSYSHLGAIVRRGLRAQGARALASEKSASPVMTTFEVPPDLTTLEFLKLAESWGYRLAGHSNYLQDRRLAQIATYGEFEPQDFEGLFRSWGAWKMRRSGVAKIAPE